MIQVDKVWLEDVTMSVKTMRARMRFTVGEDVLVPDKLRKKLQRWMQNDESLHLRLVDDNGEVRFESDALLKAASVIIGKGGGVLTFQIGGLNTTFEKLNVLSFLAKSESQSVTLQVAALQRGLW